MSTPDPKLNPGRAAKMTTKGRIRRKDLEEYGVQGIAIIPIKVDGTIGYCANNNNANSNGWNNRLHTYCLQNRKILFLLPHMRTSVQLALKCDKGYSHHYLVLR